MYRFTIVAGNEVSVAVQDFTLTVEQAPAITSAANTTFATGQAGSFTVTSSGFPAAALSVQGALPAGVSFTDNGDGTATLAGTPAAGTGGVYRLTITAANGASPDATQSLTLTVTQPPAITSAAEATFATGQAGSFTVRSSGFPAPALSVQGALPAGVSFTDNGDGTATLAGTPAAGTVGVYRLTITAANGASSTATQELTLRVGQAPAITSEPAARFTTGQAGTFTFTSSGSPTPALSARGALPLPEGVSYTDNGDGTATLAGTPAAGTGGVYRLTITAANGDLPRRDPGVRADGRPAAGDQPFGCLVHDRPGRELHGHDQWLPGSGAVGAGDVARRRDLHRQRRRHRHPRGYARRGHGRVLPVDDHRRQRRLPRRDARHHLDDRPGAGDHERGGGDVHDRPGRRASRSRPAASRLRCCFYRERCRPA